MTRTRRWLYPVSAVAMLVVLVAAISASAAGDDATVKAPVAPASSADQPAAVCCGGPPAPAAASPALACQADPARAAGASTRLEREPDAADAPDHPGKATALKARTDCADHGRPVAVLTWDLAETRGSQQRIALTTREEGFEEASYQLSDPLPADATTYTWKTIAGQDVHYWRVLTLQPEGWVASATSTFEGRRCAPPAGTPEAASPSGPEAFEPVVPLAIADPACAPTFEDINPDNSDLDGSDPDGGTGGRVNGMASVAGDNQVFYLASEWGGVYRSDDQGVEWRRLVGHLPTAAWDVEVDPSNTQIVYATSFADGRVPPITGIQVSRDGGTTWTHPATAHPDPALEGTPSDNTPAGFVCSNTKRSEPSAFGISIRPDASNNVYIGTNCGLAISNDSGVTWRFVDPTPATSASNVWDVVARAGGANGQSVIDIVGQDGHRRSTDGGTNWSAVNNLPGGASTGDGRTSIGVSPDEAYVLLVSGRDANLYESDDAGATWNNLGRTDPIRGGGRIPFISVNDTTAGFDVWTGGVSLYRVACTTPGAPAVGGAARCPTGANPLPAGWFGGFTRGGIGNGTGAHDDVGDVVFDSQTAVDAVPRLYSGDGGVYFAQTTSAAPTGTGNLVWEQPDVTPHGLWVYGMSSADQAGDSDEDVYIGCQDNGVFGNTMVGDANAAGNWHHRKCCDGFDLGSDDTTTIYTRGSFGNGRQFPTYIADRGLPGNGETQINTYPAGGLTPAFNFAESVANWGTDQFAMLMQDCIDTYPADGQDNDNNNVIDDGGETNGCPGGVAGSDGGLFITTDVTASPIVWTELGAAEPFSSAQMVEVQVAIGTGGTPTFYVQVGGGNGLTADQLWKFAGTNPAGTWTQVDNNIALALGVATWAVDPNNPNRLIASALTAGNPRMVRSDDGGATWVGIPQLDAMMTGGGAFNYVTQAGATDFTGLGGYPQPLLLAYDPEDSNIVVAAGRDSGIFLSRNGGRRFGLLTDPFTPAITGIPNIPRAWFASFDHEPADDKFRLFVGTQGFGVWKITLPLDAPVLTVPGGLDFGEVCVDTTGTATLNVCNTGSGCNNLLVDQITSSDPQFQVTEPSSGFPVEISPDFCFPFQVTFTPTAPGPATATLSISSNDPVQGTTDVTVNGVGTVPNLVTVIADAGSFGDVCRDTFKDLPLTISNSGGCPLTITGISSLDPLFQIPSVMVFPLVIAPGDSLQVPIRFAPGAATPFGAHGTTINILSDDPDTPIKVVPVSANVPPGDVRVTGSTDFGDVCPGALAEKTVSVCNVGKCNLNVISVAFDPPCADFTLVNNPFPAPVSPDSCEDVVIRFTPTSVGPKSCTLKIVTDDPDTPVVMLTVTGNVPVPIIDVPPDLGFPATVLQSIDACESPEPFPVSNNGTCILTITDYQISANDTEYSIDALPSFPILLEPGHVAGEGDLSLVFGPEVLEPERVRSGEVTVTYVSDPILGTQTSVSRALCGEAVRTGARVLVTAGGVPLANVEKIQLQRINANRNKKILDTNDVARNLTLQTVLQPAPCGSFLYHREYGTASNPIQLLAGSYQVTVTAIVNGKHLHKTVGFDVGSCTFNPTIVVNF